MLGDKTFPQIRAIDRAYQSKYDKTLVQLINSEKSLRGNSECCESSTRTQADPAVVEYALRGLVLGPLDFDVWLLNKALEGSVRNDVSLSFLHPLRVLLNAGARRPCLLTFSSLDHRRPSLYSRLPINEELLLRPLYHPRPSKATPNLSKRQSWVATARMRS